MFQPVQKAVETFAARLGANSRAVPQIAVPFQRRNSLWQQVPGAETQKQAAANGVANGASITVWTAAGGNILYIVHLSFSSSVAGIVRLDYNGVAIWSGLIPAASFQSLSIAGLGVYLYPAAGSLVFVNQTGAASDLRVNAWGAEVVA